MPRVPADLGGTQGHRNLIAGLGTPRRSWRKSDDVVSTVYDGIAVLHGCFTGHANVKGGDFTFVETYSSAWRYQDGRWGPVVEHGTVVRDDWRVRVASRPE